MALIVTVVAAFYLLTCAVWPFGKCRRCKGVGKFKSPFGNAFRHCGRCDGSGLRVRFGRKVIGYFLSSITVLPTRTWVPSVRVVGWVIRTLPM